MGMGEEGDIEARWSRLEQLARLNLEDEGLATLERQEGKVSRRLARMGLSGPPVDVLKVKRFLVGYGDSEKRFDEQLKEVGLSRQDLYLAWKVWPVAKVVYEFVKDARRAARLEAMVDDSDVAARRLLTEDECKLSAKMAMFALERLDRKHFGESEEGGGEREGRSTTYQITGVQINMLPGDAVKRLLPKDGVVDVDAVLAGVEELGADG